MRRIIVTFFVLVVLNLLEDVQSVIAQDEEFNERIYMNLSADPCDNFYEFTCGNFQNYHTLDANDASVTLIDQFSILEEKLAAITHEILKAEIHPNDPEALKKAKSAYIACTDNAFMDSYDMLYPEVEVIRKYKGFPVLGKSMFSEADLVLSEDFGWNELADMAAEFGINIFLTPSLYFDTQNASRNILRISTDAMEIPVQIRPQKSPSYDEAIEEGFMAMANNNHQKNGTLRSSIKKTVTSMELLLRKLVLKLKDVLGSDRSDDYLFERVANISNFLVGVYYGYIPEGTEVSPITNDTTAYVVTLKQLNDWTQKHFGDKVKLDWVEYVQRLLQFTHVEVDENFLVLHPTDLHTSLYGVLNWVSMNDQEIIKSAALLRIFVYTATDSDAESRTYFNDYLNATKKTIYPRWEYCTRKIIDATDTLSLGLAVAYEYQRGYFNTSELTDALTMINDLQTTFKEIINETDWMDDDSKSAALTKADNIITLLGYPEFITNPKLLDQFYENLEITTWNHFENSRVLRAFRNSYTLNMISHRERKAWEKSPFNANAYMNRQNNRIILPVSMLTSIFFQGSTSSILDYSRLGMIISHEMTHGFDSQGFLYNQFGIIEPWWTEKTVENFKNNSQCFIDQYSNYTIPEIDVNLSGSGSLNENLADNGGLRIAFRAIQNILARGSSLKLGSNELTPAQQFFVGYGTMWCSTESKSYLTALAQTCNTTTNCHARSRMRVNGVVSNMEEFSSAFNCPVGSPMNPENKCILW